MRHAIFLECETAEREKEWRGGWAVRNREASLGVPWRMGGTKPRSDFCCALAKERSFFSVSPPGLEPGTWRSKRRMISISPRRRFL